MISALGFHLNARGFFFATQKRPPEMGVICFQKWLPLLVTFARKQRTQKWPQMTPKSGSQKKTIRAQVSVWQRWIKWLKQVALADEDLVVVNMDETAVQHEYQSRAGNSVMLGRRTCSELRC